MFQPLIAGLGFMPETRRGLRALVTKAIFQTRVAKSKHWSWQRASMTSPTRQLLDSKPSFLAEDTTLGVLWVICSLSAAGVPRIGLVQIGHMAGFIKSHNDAVANVLLRVYSNAQDIHLISRHGLCDSETTQMACTFSNLESNNACIKARKNPRRFDEAHG